MKRFIGRRSRWRPAVLILGLLGVLTVLEAAFSVPRDAAALLGIPLPSSTTNVQVELRTHFLGEYDGYVRFEIAPQDVSLLLSDAAFQSRPASTDLMEVFQGASLGRRFFALHSTQQRPAWWRPERGHHFMLAYRFIIEV